MLRNLGRADGLPDYAMQCYLFGLVLCLGVVKSLGGHAQLMLKRFAELHTPPAVMTNMDVWRRWKTAAHATVLFDPCKSHCNGPPCRGAVEKASSRGMPAQMLSCSFLHSAEDCLVVAVVCIRRA